MLPSRAYSREHEFEADRLGAYLAAAACYDAAAGVESMFAVFKELEFGNSTDDDAFISVHPSLLATHPSSVHRIRALRALMTKPCVARRARRTQPAAHAFHTPLFRLIIGTLCQYCTI